MLERRAGVAVDRLDFDRGGRLHGAKGVVNPGEGDLAVLDDENCVIGVLEEQTVFFLALTQAVFPLGDSRRHGGEAFAHLADLTKRVDNILAKGEQTFRAAREELGGRVEFKETKAAALELWRMIPSAATRIDERVSAGDYRGVIDVLAEFVGPVEQFFVDVLVLDPNNPEATLHRKELLAQLSGVLTRCFDIRELAGEADRRQDRG